MNINEFQQLLGQTIMFCQIIEHDIKYIFSIMCDGEIENNLLMIEKEKWTLGKTLLELKKLDFSDKQPYITKEDYDFLQTVTKKRNYWCHKTCLNFIYINNYLYSKEYEIECQRLINDNKQLAIVYKNVEKVRLKALNDFR